MKVILQQDVKGQGKKGQLINVSDGYARNFLFPKNMAIPATESAMAVLKVQEKAKQRKLEEEIAKAKEDAKRLESCVVRITAKAGAGGKLFGSVTNKEVSEALMEQCGIEIEKNRIEIGEPIKAYGSYEVKCKFGHEINGVIHLLVTEQ